jgi:uncharacterized repeat protein (TIGR03803 family)
LYGTTQQNGFGYGTVFEINTSGTLTSLYSFCLQGPPCTDGDGPVAGLVQATNGDLYGTTEYGGSRADGFGSVFKITPSGTLTTVYAFPLSEDGCAPEPTAGLVQATNGDLYGATTCGGLNGGGTVFEITAPINGNGKLTTRYNFCAVAGISGCGNDQPSYANGYDPVAGLIQATNGILYGTTVRGGINGGGTLFKITTVSTPPNGETVSFQKGATVLGTGTLSGGLASFTTSTLPVGTTSIKAVYGGDAYFKTSTSTAVKQVVVN